MYVPLPLCNSLRTDIQPPQIYKTQNTFRPSQSIKYKTTVQEMLDAVSTDETERSAFLGPEYEKLRLWMQGLYRHNVPSTGAPQHALEIDDEEEKPLKKRRVARNT